MIPLTTLNFLLALGTVALQALTLALLALYFLKDRVPDLEDSARAVGKYGLWIGLALVVASGALALYYDALGFPACPYCWWQRIFLFPQAVLFAVALWRRDAGIAIYSTVLSAIGALIALYQHYLHMGGASLVPCPATASDVLGCAERFFFEFGYITFPLVAFTGFAFLIVLMLFVRGSANTALGTAPRE